MSVGSEDSVVDIIIGVRGGWARDQLDFSRGLIFGRRLTLVSGNVFVKVHVRQIQVVLHHGPLGK